ncbi:polysaccharide deacetylase family protein [Nocardia sp. CA2R105]|uniref:polysaccharide deacetylase family protein n=1 Tax=Nocardia coffeae TaxID=2873381 RepID=UPI001CA66BE4|nr:polysaccharide deacetylase family protein [Nocardia coffeae]MBY8855345.1 polysaccharide deacetylase family protein [Nocardia coffeae]
MRRKLLLTGALVLVVLLAAGTGLYVLMNSRTYQVAGRLVHRVDTADKVVALTLDDGPSDRTSEILATLCAAGIHATFYLIGDQIAAHPDRAAAIARAGHEIGNHTYHHQRMVLITPETARAEVERTDAQIRKIGYPGPITFRPPNGKKLFALPLYLSRHNRTTVTWDVEPDSGKHPTTDEIVTETVSKVRPGSIILLHAMYPSGASSLAAIPRIVGELRGRGYRFVTVSELIRH